MSSGRDDKSEGRGPAGGRNANRRKALELAAMLPEDPRDARDVLSYMLVILNDFIDDAPVAEGGRLHIVRNDGG